MDPITRLSGRRQCAAAQVVPVQAGGTAQPTRVTVPPPGAVLRLPGIRVAGQWPSQSINWPAGSLAAPRHAAGVCGMPDRETDASAGVAESQAVTANAAHCDGCESHHDETHSETGLCARLLGRGLNRGQLSDRAWQRPR